MPEDNERALAEIREKTKKLLVEGLVLEDISSDDIKDDEVLFGEGLDLDSLDAVEIVVLLQRNFGIEIPDSERGREVFYSIDTLSRFIHKNMQKES